MPYSRHSYKIIPFVLILLVLSVLPVSAGGILDIGTKGDNRSSSDMGAAEEHTVIRSEPVMTAPDTAYPGDCLVLSFTMPSQSGVDESVPNEPSPVAGKRHSVAVSLLTQEDKIISRSFAFTTGDSCMTALLALPCWLEAGSYTINALISQDDKTDRLKSDLVLLYREFPSEEVALNKKNTAIKTNVSPERMDQIEKLNALFATWNQTACQFAGPYRLPISQTRRTSAFGERRVYRYANGKKDVSIHYGIDFGIPVGTPVFATGDGTVVMSEERISTGNTIVIEHLPGVYSLYYHLDTLLAGCGEFVRAGTLIGRSGNTGLSTGPHLHWEFRVNGEAVSPDWFVGRVLF